MSTRDRLLRPRTQARFAARLPGATTIVVEGGHSVPVMQQAVVAAAAEDLA